jgi:predicted MFS family arabinose efflux permease
MAERLGQYHSLIAPSPRPAARAFLSSPTFLLAALAVCVSITFQILLPVVPVMAERQGPHGMAGAATAALFIGAVAGELCTPWLMTRVRSLHLLVGGELLTAIPCLVYAIPGASTWELLAGAVLRGAGLGLAVVVSVALLSELTPPHRRGSAIGVYSLALSAPGILVPSIGVSLLAAGRADVDALIGFASGVAGALIALRIPDRPMHLAEGSTNLLGAIRRPGLFLVFAGFVLTSCSFGGVVTFVPVALPLDGLGSAAAFLLVAGAARTASRWVAGVAGDRRPARVVLIAGVASALVGLVALAAHGGVALVLFAAVAYGAGYGAVQTGAFLAMAQRGTARDSGAISALWNSGIDLGSSLGGTLIGLAASRFGYGAAAWVLPAVVLAAVPLFLWPGPRPLNPAAEPPLPETYAVKT